MNQGKFFSFVNAGEEKSMNFIQELVEYLSHFKEIQRKHNFSFYLNKVAFDGDLL